MKWHELTIEEKVASTIKNVDRLVAAGWKLEEAVTNQRNLWNLSKKRHNEVRIHFSLKPL